ncbi:hypothetical protein CK203_084628 [Vitis vinifera]|uniref:Uncharacterized protein n=1 Tax=Vitis vinifera TaxID=29760 RepID=A0A438DKI5_VITVI|nr:hypothetical protein CK203_084628 [Vitis vinifera]
MKGKGKIGFLDGSLQAPKTNDLAYEAWDHENSMALSWLINSVDLDIARLFSTYPLENSTAYYNIMNWLWQEFNLNYDRDWNGELMLTSPRRCRKKNRLWKAIKKLGPLVSSRLSFVVSNGQRVSFWKDKWCGTTPLCDSFPSLFALATPKEAWVKDVWIVSQSREMGGVAALASLGLSMIGRWMRWRGYCYVCVGRE